jgi:hypothetical protein
MSVVRQGVIYNRMFILVASADHVSPLLGASPIVMLSKAGAPFYTAAGPITEVGDGWYEVYLSITDTNVAGDLSYHITAALADNTDFTDQVVASPLVPPTPPAPPTPTPGPNQTVAFNYAVWAARYPEFANISRTMAQAYFDEAGLYFANCGWTGALSQASTLLNMLTAHIAWLYSPRDGQGNPSSTGTIAPMLIGRISSATEGSVTVQTELTSSGSPSEAFFNQTRYGYSFWAATSQFRTMRYSPRPTRVANGAFPSAPYGRIY